MKRLFTVLGTAVAAIAALVSCQVKEVESVSGPMTITASSELTKTTNSGVSTLWASGDQLHVFYQSGSSFEKAGVFKLSEGEGTTTGSFTCETATTPSSSATWYAVYTGSSGAAPATPAASADGDGFIYIGRSNGIDQPSYDDMSKVSSSHCPMYAVSASVPAGEAPGFTMKQIASVIEFNVVNASKASTLSISSLQLNEVTDLAGQYYLDVTSGSPVLTPVAGRTITDPQVKITKPADLQPGESAKIYMPVKPFVHGADASMNVEITGTVDGKVGTKTIVLNPSTEAQRTFAAGKIKTVTVNVDGFDAATQTNTVAEVLNGETGVDYLVQGALVTLVYGKGFFVSDGTGTILAYAGSAPSVKKGDKVTLSGQISTYSGMTQFNRPVVTVESSNNNVSLSAVEWAKEEIDEASTDPVCEYVSIASAEFSSATSAVVKGSDGASSATISMTAATDPAVTLAAGTYNVTGYIYGCHNSKVYMYVDSAEESQGTPVVEKFSTIKEALDGEEGEYSIEEALVTLVCGNNVLVTDNTGTILVYNSQNTLVVGDKVTIKGNTKEYNNLKEFNKPAITKTGTGTVSLTPAVWSDSQMAAAYGNAQIAYVQYEVTLSAARVGIIPQSEAVLYLNKASGVSTSQNKRYILTGYVYGWFNHEDTESGVVTKEVIMFVDSASEVFSESTLQLSSLTVAFDAEPTGSQEIKVTCDNSDWTVSGAPSWLTVTADKDNSKIILSAAANTSAETRSAELTVAHSNGELTKTLTVNQAGKTSGGGGSKTVKLTNEDIVNAGDPASGYQAWTITSAAGQTYNAFAIKNFHSKATNDKQYIQLKKYKSDVASYIQIPALGTKIMSIKMTVSSANKPMDGGESTATLFFSASNSTSAEGDGVASGMGASSVTIDASALNLNSGYITTSAGVRIWEMEISYN